MVLVSIRAGDADEAIGSHEFAQLPREGEIVTVPWPADPHGVRIFMVEEVHHIADGVSGTPWGDGPVTGLRVEEID